MAKSRSRALTTIQPINLETVDRARSDYHMAKRTGAQKRQRRGVPTQGAGADYHYRSESDWLWMGELAWDIYRNNMVVGSIVDRAVENTLQGGFAYDPNTGDEKLDQDLLDWWTEISEDPSECDPGEELCFCDQEEIVLRSTLVAGDIFGVPFESGQVGLTEAHQCRSPTYNTREKQNIFHGVEMEPATRRRVNYWFGNEPIDPARSTIKKSELTPVAAYDEDGERNVFHVRFPKRATQTRGITAFTPLFDVAGYHDDVQFLKLVQARAASLFAFVRQRTENFDPQYQGLDAEAMGRDVSNEKGASWELAERQFSEVAPGSVLKGLPGETIVPWTAGIPNPEFFPHVKLLLTFVGINLGMPLVMALMDASETNFSGYRGAVDQARMGFRKNQKRTVLRWHQPYVRFKIFKRGESDATIARWIERSRRPRARVNIFRHRWHVPSWPYIEPTADATADLIRTSNMLTSPRRQARERGAEWTDIVRETVEDRSRALKAAFTEAKKLKDEFGLEAPLEVLAAQIAPLPMPERIQLTISAKQEAPVEATPQRPATDED